MGTVYEALDQRLNTTVALKETHFTDEKLRKQFEREAQLLARLRHPAMTRVIDHFTENDGQYLVMDYIAGEDLWEMLQRQGAAFSINKIIIWADQLLDALNYLHSQDPPVIHRDIKPQNLKFTERGQIVLLDFGLAKGFAGQISRVTTSGSIFGYTPNYAPLEQIQGTGTDPRSDLYSLSATLYNLVTGVTPPDALSRASAMVGDLPDPLRAANELNPKVSSEITQILNQAMAQHPSKRFASAAEMQKALRYSIQKQIALGEDLEKPTPTNSNIDQHKPIPATVASPTIATPTPPLPSNKPEGSHSSKRNQQPVKKNESTRPRPTFNFEDFDWGSAGGQIQKGGFAGIFEILKDLFGKPNSSAESKSSIPKLHSVSDRQRERRVIRNGVIVVAFVGLFMVIVFFAVSSRNNSKPELGSNFNTANDISSKSPAIHSTSVASVNSSPSQAPNSNQNNSANTKSIVSIRLGPFYTTEMDGSDKQYGGTGMPMTILTSAGRFTKKATGKPKAYVEFDNIPCGEKITVIIADYPRGSEGAKGYRATRSTHSISCGKPKVELGEFEIMWLD